MLTDLNNCKTEISQLLSELVMKNPVEVGDVTYTDYNCIQEFINVLIKWFGELYQDPSPYYVQMSNLLTAYLASNNYEHYWALIKNVFLTLADNLKDDDIYKSDLSFIFDGINNHTSKKEMYSDVIAFFEKINIWLKYIYDIK